MKLVIALASIALSGCTKIDSRQAVLHAVAPIAAAPVKPKPDLAQFAGSYYHGDGLGDNNLLDLTKDGTFTYSSHACDPYLTTTTGKFRVDGDALVMEFD